MLCPNVATFDVICDYVTHDSILLVIFCRDFPQRIPGTNITPACIQWHHRGPLCAFHHRVIYRLFGRIHKSLGPDTSKYIIVAHRLEGFLHRTGDVRALGQQFSEEVARLEYEHAAVPVIVSGRNVAFCGLLIGLLDEAVDLVADAKRPARFDVAITGFRAGGLDAKRDQIVLLRQRHRLGQCVQKGIVIRDHVIRRQHHQNRIIMGQGLMGAEGNGRRGIATLWLQDNGPWGRIDCPQLLCHQKSVFLVADQDRFFGLSDSLEAQYRVLQQGSVVNQRQQLLGVQFTRQRPQAGSRATA